MKWTKLLYWALGAHFLIKLREKADLQKVIREAQALKAQAKKPLLLVSDNHHQGFDVVLNSNQTPWQLPYPDKAFAAVVSDALEHIPYPQQAIAEWNRVADATLISTHIIWSPETWLDLRHRYTFIGTNVFAIHPTLNWAILGGIGYWLWKRRYAQKSITADTGEEIAEDNTDQETPVEELPVMAGTQKVEKAPLVVPDALPKPPPPPAAPPRRRRKSLAKRDSDLSGPQANLTPPPVVNVVDKEIAGIPDGYKNLNGHRGVNLNLSGGAQVDMKAITQHLKSKGIETLAFDPVRYSERHNQQVISKLQRKPADSATLYRLFSTPPWSQNPEERSGAIQLAYENVKRG